VPCLVNLGLTLAATEHGVNPHTSLPRRGARLLPPSVLSARLLPHLGIVTRTVPTDPVHTAPIHTAPLAATEHVPPTYVGE